MDEKKKESKKIHFGVHLEEELVEEFRRFCKEEGRTITWQMTKMMKEFLEKNKKD